MAVLAGRRLRQFPTPTGPTTSAAMLPGESCAVPGTGRRQGSFGWLAEGGWMDVSSMQRASMRPRRQPDCPSHQALLLFARAPTPLSSTGKHFVDQAPADTCACARRLTAVDLHTRLTTPETNKTVSCPVLVVSLTLLHFRILFLLAIILYVRRV